MNLHSQQAELTIGALARRTGVSASTLRAWERRYGFPVPHRLESGHRRYAERDANAIRSAIRDRQAGTPLAIAVQRAKDARLGPRTSVFGGMRHAMPNVAPAVLSKRAMLAVSRAIEDESAARADRPILIAAFQQGRFWRASEPRWRSLAITAHAAIVLAQLRNGRHQGNLWQIPIDPTTPIAREWVVVCDSPTFSACLAGVELPDDVNRRFEALWTTDPLVVREMARISVDITSSRKPALDPFVTAAVLAAAVPTHDNTHTTAALMNRMVAYLDHGY